MCLFNLRNGGQIICPKTAWTSAVIRVLAAGNCSRGIRLRLRASRLQTRDVLQNQPCCRLKMVSIRAIALIPTSQGLISGAPTAKGNRDSVVAGTMTQRLRNNPTALRNEEMNRETKNHTNDTSFLSLFLGRTDFFPKPDF